jgi:nucleoid-associated protein YgaU
MDILTDKQYKNYDYISRYASFPYYYHIEDKKFIYGTTAQLSESNGYTLHKVVLHDTLDSLALDYYNNPTLFWLIADFNKIQNPYAKLELGTELKIPSISEIKFGD